MKSSGKILLSFFICLSIGSVAKAEPEITKTKKHQTEITHKAAEKNTSSETKTFKSITGWSIELPTCAKQIESRVEPIEESASGVFGFQDCDAKIKPPNENFGFSIFGGNTKLKSYEKMRSTLYFSYYNDAPSKILLKSYDDRKYNPGLIIWAAKANCGPDNVTFAFSYTVKPEELDQKAKEPPETMVNIVKSYKCFYTKSMDKKIIETMKKHNRE